ncbi:helix-turn-helix domain-containing protein [Faecalicatena contorta]|uniref:AraC-type DNA-binding protein n=1 Tax=Faecalicatena contorta TaxID=39482 RepID=A0A316AHP1_9FIRM|nr:AraC family transcriptional regulator [Faecalicatena contorta]PWJ49417.1 AraC family transcriptional regulator [Faecalicatena contorta]SUQ14661.1 AraC-type DNA-binding protein [Faecalicatena contorta]
MPNIENYYQEILLENGFQTESPNNSFNPIGKLYSIPPELGKGVFWFYGQKDLYSIKIHDFYFYEDSFFDLEARKCLGICFYESISGEEISPYRRLTAGCVKCFIGGYRQCKTLVHKNIPIRTIDIEIRPAYYEKYLQETFPNEYVDPHEAFHNISWADNFPEMIRLLRQIWNYRGDGMAAKLFYDGKVAEAISLIIEYNRGKKSAQEVQISRQDFKSLENVTSYVNDHFNYDISVNHLCCIACMSRTKLKTLFKQVYECTITEYISHRRLSHAETLLSTTDLTIKQIASAVGYSNAGRFASIFKKSTGLFPAEYRKSAQRNHL